MKITKKMLIGLSILGSPVAFASEGVGTHGGNAVVCFANRPEIADILTLPGKTVSRTIPNEYIPEVTSVETLDLYEARTGIHGNKPRMIVAIGENETEEQYIEKIMKRFWGWNANAFESKSFGNLIWEGLEVFSEVDAIQDERFLPAQDIDPIRKADTGCVYTTIAKQSFIGFSNRKKLVIDDRLYSHPVHVKEKRSRAILKIHEYVLAKLGTRDHTTEAVRAVVAYLIAQNVSVADLRFVLGLPALDAVYPFPVYSLVKQTGAELRRELNENLVKADWFAGEKYTTAHLRDLPGKFRRAYVESSGNGKSHLNGLSINSKLYCGDHLTISMNKKNCRRLMLFGIGYQGAVSAAVEAAAAELRRQKQNQWKAVFAFRIGELDSMRLTKVRRDEIVAAISQWDVFDWRSTIDFEKLSVNPNEALFP